MSIIKQNKYYKLVMDPSKDVGRYELQERLNSRVISTFRYKDDAIEAFNKKKKIT